MEQTLDKLHQMETDSTWSNWSNKEKQKIVEIYSIICKKESHLFDLIYMYHGCDSWEDIFRDYDRSYLDDKSRGVEIALDEINSRVQNEVK